MGWMYLILYLWRLENLLLIRKLISDVGKLWRPYGGYSFNPRSLTQLFGKSCDKSTIVKCVSNLALLKLRVNIDITSVCFYLNLSIEHRRIVLYWIAINKLLLLKVESLLYEKLNYCLMQIAFLISLWQRSRKTYAPGEDRTHDLQIALFVCDYETDALPTALPRHIYGDSWQADKIQSRFIRYCIGKLALYG